jgi:2-polyprenyl-6-hydroxyphenyl methylase/3-demethylubiquinone-9 3-methyltransferase
MTASPQHRANVDPAEVNKFEELASRWWDPHSEFKPLHEINPLRLNYIDQRAQITGKRVLDVGCGGGILAESMARRGAVVTGIDAGQAPLTVARLHALESGVQVEYRNITAEALAAESPASYDVVTCMEMLEHVPNPASVIAACAQLVKPGGHLFFSTINRTPKGYLFAIIGAEYLLQMLPKGTHDYRKFIRPHEMDGWMRAAALEMRDLSGMSYNPLSRRYSLGKDIEVNYLIHAVRCDE